MTGRRNSREAGPVFPQAKGSQFLYLLPFPRPLPIPILGLGVGEAPTSMANRVAPTTWEAARTLLSGEEGSRSTATRIASLGPSKTIRSCFPWPPLCLASQKPSRRGKTFAPSYVTQLLQLARRRHAETITIPLAAHNASARGSHNHTANLSANEPTKQLRRIVGRGP